MKIKLMIISVFAIVISACGQKTTETIYITKGTTSEDKQLDGENTLDTDQESQKNIPQITQSHVFPLSSTFENMDEFTQNSKKRKVTISFPKNSKTEIVSARLTNKKTGLVQDFYFESENELQILKFTANVNLTEKSITSEEFEVQIQFNNNETSNYPITILPDFIARNTEEYTLLENMLIPGSYFFDHIVLENAHLLTQDKNYSIQAKKIYSSKSTISTFQRGQTAVPNRSGRSGGTLTFRFLEAEGMLSIHMYGENGGEQNLVPQSILTAAKDGSPGAPGKTERVCDPEVVSKLTNSWQRIFKGINNCRTICVANPTNGKDGEKGLKGLQGLTGYAGGNSGSLSIEFSSLNDNFQLNTDVLAGLGSEGGKGGTGGPGGKGGAAVQAHSSCSPASDGLPGPQGDQGDRGLHGQDGIKQEAIIRTLK